MKNEFMKALNCWKVVIIILDLKIILVTEVIFKMNVQYNFFRDI